MSTKNNWLVIAMQQEQTAPQQAQPGQPGQPDGEQGLQEGEAPVSPEPTPTTEQNVNKGKQQRAEMDRTMHISIPDAARRALPALNQSLYFLTNELMSRDDMKLSDQAARSLAVEIMAEWLAASRKGTVSDLATIVTRSQRVQSIVTSMP